MSNIEKQMALTIKSAKTPREGVWGAVVVWGFFMGVDESNHPYMIEVVCGLENEPILNEQQILKLAHKINLELSRINFTKQKFSYNF